jgi:hypothetical protein
MDDFVTFKFLICRIFLTCFFYIYSQLFAINMDSAFKETLWKQFGASIDMLENAIRLCTDELWGNDKNFWYNAYHCLFWLDYYLTLEPSQYNPPSPFTLSEFDPLGALPDRVYSKDELLNYLRHDRRKCHDLIATMTDEIANARWVNEYKNYSVIEMLLYNMRHVQHHAAQLNLLLRQGMDNSPSWVSQTKDDL